MISFSQRSYTAAVVVCEDCQGALAVKNSPASTGDRRDSVSIPASERSPEEGNDNPLQCLNIEKWESLFKSEVLPQYTDGEWTRKTVSFRSALNEWDVEGELRDPSWREKYQRGLLASFT